MGSSTHAGTQLKHVARPFGEVNVRSEGNNLAVRATIQLGVHKEGAQTGIALDGSGSMEAEYRQTLGGGTNAITPVARKLCAFLARSVDQDGGTTAIYWAVGADGGGIQELGDLTAARAEAHTFAPPKRYGGDTKLLPAVKYFVDRFKDAPWGMYVFLTDGAMSDLEPVKEYTVELAKAVAAKRRNPVKLILVGVGAGVREDQMHELDDLDTGTAVDLWDHKIAKDMRDVTDIFAEVVEANARVAGSGRILAPDGSVLKDFTGTGVPALIEFAAPAGTDYFTLVADGLRFHQPLRDGAPVPPSDPVPASKGGSGPPAGGAAANEEEETVVAAVPPPAALNPEEAMNRFLQEIKLRYFDDKYVDVGEERDVLRIASQLGIGLDVARAVVAKECDDHACVQESRVLAEIKAQVAAAAGNDGRVDQKEFDVILAGVTKAVRGKRNDREAKAMIVRVMEETGNNKIKKGWFSNWYTDLKKELGIA